MPHPGPGTRDQSPVPQFPVDQPRPSPDGVPAPVASTEATQYESAQFEPAQFESAQFESAQFESIQFEPAQFEPAEVTAPTELVPPSEPFLEPSEPAFAPNPEPAAAPTPQIAAPDEPMQVPAFRATNSILFSAPRPAPNQITNPWLLGLWASSSAGLFLAVVLPALSGSLFVVSLSTALNSAGSLGIVAATVLSALHWWSAHRGAEQHQTPQGLG
jgi:hypothetical protein